MAKQLPDAALYGTIQGLIQQIRRNPDRPVILTEGDSWFSFPLHSNTVDHLRRLGRFSVLRLEKPGDEILRMLDTKPLRKLGKHLQRTYLRRGGKDYRAEALLMSGGGNDLLDSDHLVTYLRSNANGTKPTDFIHIGRVRNRLRQIKIAYEALCNVRDDKNPDCVIYAHGYDYAIPGDRPVRILWGLKKIGPWMHRAMAGIYDPDVVVPKEHRRGVARWLVDEFNTMLGSIRRRKFVHVETVGTLTDNQWNDEIHPRSMGFKAIARKFEAALRVQFPTHF